MMWVQKRHKYYFWTTCSWLCWWKRKDMISFWRSQDFFRTISGQKRAKLIFLKISVMIFYLEKRDSKFLDRYRHPFSVVAFFPCHRGIFYILKTREWKRLFLCSWRSLSYQWTKIVWHRLLPKSRVWESMFGVTVRLLRRTPRWRLYRHRCYRVINNRLNKKNKEFYLSVDNDSRQGLFV